MKIERAGLIAFAMILVGSGTVLSEPLATGVGREAIPGESFVLTLKVSKEAKPGIQFYPCVRLVLNDGTWVDGTTGCFPSGATAGQETGGDVTIAFNEEVPADKTVKYVELVVMLADPKGAAFGIKEGEGFSFLSDAVLKELKEKGGMVLRFPIAALKPDSKDRPLPPHAGD